MSHQSNLIQHKLKLCYRNLYPIAFAMSHFHLDQNKIETAIKNILFQHTTSY